MSLSPLLSVLSVLSALHHVAHLPIRTPVITGVNCQTITQEAPPRRSQCALRAATVMIYAFETNSSASPNTQSYGGRGWNKSTRAGRRSVMIIIMDLSSSPAKAEPPDVSVPKKKQGTTAVMAIRCCATMS